ncbi:MAG: hypothetical protein HQL67_11575 [Magnetococcales bacterium]|nr:hypothetical protein [Magnetococcales bacterium]
MSVIIKTDLPLEKLLEEKSTDPNNGFPDRNVSYWHRYVGIKQWIADTYYQNAGSGLALEGERFTKHDIFHVDDVIEAAGHLLGDKANGTTQKFIINTLTPYEIYVLLFAILLHDAGNAKRRDGHEKEPKGIIAEMGEAKSGLNPIERKLIASIAEAHGGRTKDGSKDTIPAVISSKSTSIGQLEVRSRMLAAVLRFADELAENPRRADDQALKKPYDPPESAIHNLYCKIIDTKIDYCSRQISLNYLFGKDRLKEEFLYEMGSCKKIFLVDYISGRIEKCDRERRYCSKFMSPDGFGFDRIRVSLEIHDENDETIEKISLELSDEGYPDSSLCIREKEPQFDGKSLKEKYYRTTKTNKIISQPTGKSKYATIFETIKFLLAKMGQKKLDTLNNE